jgi:hypothetical protein
LSKEQIDQLRDDLQEFKAPRYEALYTAWKERGDVAVMGDGLQQQGGCATFNTHLLPYEYPEFPEEKAEVVA